MATVSSGRILADHDDLIVEILSWLPVTSIGRFRCVSKTWKSLISGSYFVKLHVERSSRNPQIVLMLRKEHEKQCFMALFFSISSLIENPVPTFRASVGHSPISSRILFGSCNGLLSIHESLSTDEYEEHWVDFWNPVTKTSSGPSPSLRLNYDTDFQYLRNFWYNNDFYYFRNFGFGYDDRSDSYKVVIMLLHTRTLRTSVWVYCMGDQHWNCTLTNCSAFHTIDSNGHSLNGTVNWLGFSEESRKKVQIFSYDLYNDTCKYLSVPELPYKEPHANSIGILNGCLCFFLHEKTDFVVLVLKDIQDETSWTQLLRVSYNRLQINEYSSNLRILCMSGDLLLLTYSKMGYCEFIIFNLKDNKVESIEGLFQPIVFNMFSFPYAPTFISL
ncbi:F-box/kelch-repeat protein At3g23880-like [Vigna radiata var. radiata]|uniref:F-box/kelch-repeat protein At3g23880-like n=1 Tax=Vigna radiata var. radiata TaxID=3916 RepID=A0A1S3TPM9_VIGRR|nr:F-box/kelch-repeat protein At3g23880-like [Vigna radiata var. radiata]